MGLLRKALTVVVVIGLIGGAVAGAYFTGVLGKPSAGVHDYGDWGTVSEKRTEVVTSVWVQNPNPVGVKVGDSVRVSYQLYLNKVNVANGKKSGIEIQSGNNTVRISTYMQNKKLPAWWVAFIQNNETIPVRAEGSVHVAAGPLSSTFQFPAYKRTLLSDSTPVINALSQAAANAEGNYTTTIGTGVGPEDTVGYQIRRGWATWGKVTEQTTTVLFHFRIHNPSENVAVPAVPDGLGVSIDMNNITLFRAQGDAFSPRNVDGDSIIQPGETQEIVLKVQMDNSKVDDWFQSHIRKGEQTQIETRLQLVFSVKEQTFRMPQERGPAYTCQLQTAILVDDQNTSTNCGQPSSVPGGEVVANGTDDTSNQTPTGQTTPSSESTPTNTPSKATATPTATPTPTVTPTNNDPVARANATPTEGTAPLEVEFDASASSDPDGDITRYVWRFGDGSPSKEGKTVTHTYQTPGTYTVRLTVFDSKGNQDTITLEITVNSQTG